MTTTGRDAASAITEPEFSRTFTLADLSRGPYRLAVTASAAECAALTGRFDLVSLADFSVDAEAERWRGGVRVRGRIRGTAVQRSVSTLDPVTIRIDEAFDRGFLPEAAIAVDAKPGAEIEMQVDPELDDAPDILTERIDIGEIAAETLGLALDPYPRGEGEDFADYGAGPPGTAAMTDEDAKPLASLAEFRARLDSEGKK